MGPKRLRIILFGYGNMGRNHFRVLSEHPGVEVLAVVDPALDSVMLGDSRGIFLRSIQDSLLEQADAFVVASSTETHFDVATALIPFAKPILLEKPVSHRLELAQRLREQALKHGTEVRVSHPERMNPAVAKLKEVIESGVIGIPVHYSFTRAGGYPSQVKSGNNVLIDLAVHDLDVLNLLAGETSHLASVVHRSRNGEHVDTAEILLTTRSRASASLHVNWVTPTKIRTLRVTGTRGVCMVDYILQSCVLHGGNLLRSDQGVGSDYRSLIAQYQSGDRLEFGVRREEPLKLQLEQFISLANQPGMATSLCPISDSIAALELATLALERGHEGVRA
jgi:UDP-N-acetylglucosamine 3-dehydrogenase